MASRATLAYYGTTRILRAFCIDCQRPAFIIRGRFACCDEKFVGEPTKIKRMSEVALGRDTPSKKRQTQLLNEQDNRCLYCGRRFGEYVYRDKKAIRLRIHWDHKTPYCYSLDNRPDNFAAACHICNGMKSGFVYNTIEEAQIAITNRWKEKGFTDAGVRTVHDGISPEAPMAEVLLR